MEDELEGKSILIYDIETDGLDLFESECKWFGAYSYKTRKYYKLSYMDMELIEKLIKTHRILIGFNNKDFDNQILINQHEVDFKYKNIIDLRHVSKLRLPSMGVKVKNYKLKTIIDTLNICEKSKGDINYDIFKKDNWSDDEVKQIGIYLKQDIIITKDLFEWFFKQFKPLRHFLSEEDKNKYMDVKASLASLAFRVMCNLSGKECEFQDNSEKGSEVKKEKFAGGHHIEPREDRAVGNLVSIDITSAYPHAIMMGNLLSPDESGWDGGDYFNLKGKYNNKGMGDTEKALKMVFLERMKAKREKDKVKNLAYKIVINCFSEDTEIMTCKGLKKLINCKSGDLVYSINPLTEEVEIKPIEKIYKQIYKGDMIHFKDINKDLIVTPNHNMLFKRNGKINSIQKIEAKDVINKAGFYPKFKKIKGIKTKLIDMKQFSKKDDKFFIKLKNPYKNRRVDRGLIYIRNLRLHYSKTGYNPTLEGEWFFQRRKRDMLIPEFIKTKELFYLIGIMLAEGHKRIILPKKYKNGNIRGKTYYMDISQSKKINPICYNKIKSILSSMKIRTCKQDKVFTISSKFWYDFFYFKTDSFDCYIPKWCFKYDSSLLNHLHMGLYDGDGNKNHYRYSTVSKKLKDDMVKINIHLGHRTTVSKEYYNTPIRKISRMLYRIFRTSDGTYRKKQSIKYIENPTNKIVCCSVKDNHTILAGRNGRLVWTGQSFYGTLGNSVFKTFYDPIAAGDCTSIVRTILKKMAKICEENGFKVLYGFTDNVVVSIPKQSNKEELMMVVDSFVEEVKSNIPFPMDSFGLEVDKEFKFIRFFAKNCYLWVGKDNKVGYKSTVFNKNTPQVILEVFNNKMAPKIIKELDINFTEDELENYIKEVLKNNLNLAGEEHSTKSIEQYKVKTSLQYQISEKYGSGIHFLIPNLKSIGVGKAKSTKNKVGVRYCTKEEFNINKLTYNDIDISQLIKHIKLFINSKEDKNQKLKC